MKKFAALVLIGLAATTGCGGGGGTSWQDEIASSTEQLESEGIPVLSQLGIESASTEEIDASMDDLCAQFADGAMPSDMLAAFPAVIMSGLRQAGATTETLQTFGKGVDGGMKEKCPAALEDVFGAGPLASWEQAASCEGDPAALMADPASLSTMCAS